MRGAGNPVGPCRGSQLHSWREIASSEAEGERFELSSDLTARNGFRDRRIRPLCHPSEPTMMGLLNRPGHLGFRPDAHF